MKCPVCNKDNGPGVNFCEGCGRRIPRCPTCGVELTSRDRFCSNDGTRLSDDLLILVPEETVLQEPVWSQPASPVSAPVSDPWAVPIPDDFDEGTVKAGPEPTPAAPETDIIWSEPFAEETVRVTPTSGGRGWQQSPPVRNSDPIAAPAWEPAEVKPQPPQRAFCENCGKRVAPGNRYCSECQSAIHAQEARAAEKPKKKLKVILAVILVILLLLGLFAGGYALVNSDLFDWDTPSSNHVDKDEDEEEEEEDTEDTTDESNPVDATGESTAPVAGVEDPVNTDPSEEETSAPVETTEPTTEAEEDPLLYWIENCDKMYLTAADLEGFDAQMCTYARNACYAKSGRKFNSTELQQYFAQFDWYNPTVSPDNFNDNMLNAYQSANINVVLNYEREHGYR